MTNRVVTKALAGLEDLLLGTGTEDQDRKSGTIPITKIDASGLPYENAESLRTKIGKKAETLLNVAAMQALDTTNDEELYVFLLGYTTAGDGGGGLFWLDTTDTASVEDLNIVFNPDALANGRWKRMDTDNQLSLDRGDANYSIKTFDYGIQQYATALTANRTVILPTAGLYKGKKISVLRTAGGSFNLLVGAIIVLTGTGLVELIYNGTTWIVVTEPVSTSSTSGDTFNGSFEIDENNNGEPDNWTLTPLISATITIDSTDSAHGANSLKFLSGGNGGGESVSERFDVLKGETKEIEFTYKASAVDILFKADVKTYDINNNLVSTLSAYSEGAANPTSYATKTVSVAIDATAVTAEIVITGIDAASTTKGAGTTCHVDRVKPIDEASKVYVDDTVKTYVDDNILGLRVSAAGVILAPVAGYAGWSVAKAATGVYNITHTLGHTDYVPVVSARNITNYNATSDGYTDTIIQVRTFDTANTAADADFSILIKNFS